MEHLKIYNTLDSTNMEAQRLLTGGPVANGLTILALEQTKGRGQMGKTWIAQPGQHLSMTIIYQPEKLDISGLPTLGMKISLGIINALDEIDAGLQPLIKWPNDIYIQGKKLSGILIENALSGNRVQHCIIGIGMNINEAFFPPEIPNAVSLHQLTGEAYSIKIIAETIRQAVLSILDSKDPQWKSRYDQLIFGKGKKHNFTANNITFSAVVKGITEEGRLQLEKEDGIHQAFGTHEVTWVLHHDQ